MTALSTYCSARKSRAVGDIPAIHRYQSPRIAKVFEAAKILGLPFYILSGRYGLLTPEQPIPWYDHPLSHGEIPTLAEVLVSQIRSSAIDKFLYFTRGSSAATYQAALETACREANVPCCVVELEDETMSSWRDLMEAANRAKLTMVSDRSSGEREFSGLLLNNPNDGMIYFFKRGEAYEALGDPTSAASDFQKAIALFPMPEWKKRAKEAFDRVRS